MVVDRRITGVPTENIEVESVTVETPDLSIEGVEMTEDGGAIINPIEVAPENQFDSNLAELIDEEILNDISSDLISDYMVATLTDERQANLVLERNPNYKVERMRVPDEGSTTPVFAIKITKEMLEPYKTHKAMGGLVQLEDIFEV